MKICVSAAAGDLDAQIDWRFGRCPFFVIVEPDTMAFEAVPNENSIDVAGRAFCIAHPETLLNKGVDLVISGNIGPNIYHLFHAAGVDIATLTSGTVKEAVEMYKTGRLSEAEISTGATHAGMGAGVGAGGGMGMGGGRGGGRGRGTGLGMQQPMPSQPQPQAPQAPIAPKTKEEEVKQLSDMASRLEKDLEEVKRRIEELKKR